MNFPVKRQGEKAFPFRESEVCINPLPSNARADFRIARNRFPVLWKFAILYALQRPIYQQLGVE